MLANTKMRNALFYSRFADRMVEQSGDGKSLTSDQEPPNSCNRRGVGRPINMFTCAQFEGRLPKSVDETEPGLMVGASTQIGNAWRSVIDAMYLKTCEGLRLPLSNTVTQGHDPPAVYARNRRIHRSIRRGHIPDHRWDLTAV